MRSRSIDIAQTFEGSFADSSKSEKEGIHMPDDTKAFPTQTQRDPSEEYHQLHPTSLRSSGLELDPCCGDVTQGEAAKGLDRAIKMIDQQPLRPPEGNTEATKLGGSWKDTVIGKAPSNPMSRSMDKVFRR